MLKLSAAPLKQLTHEQYEARYGADTKDIALVRKFAKEYDLNVVRESVARRSVILAGTGSLPGLSWESAIGDYRLVFLVSTK